VTLDPADTYPLPLHGGELVLVRHGESTANALGIGQGRTEYPLSERGFEQARLTGAQLAILGPYDAIVSSPQQRAAQTAALIGEALDLRVSFDADLVEIDIGILSGKSWSELAVSNPVEMAAYEAAEARNKDPRNRELIPGWEPIQEVLERVWRAIAKAVENPGGRVIVVAHGGVINAFLTHLLDGDARDTPWRHSSRNCAISRIYLPTTGAVAACLMDDAHLQALASGGTVLDTPRVAQETP
jgi:broad specificity phosphatase PhoE